MPHIGLNPQALLTSHLDTVAVLIFLSTYLAVAMGGLPFLRIDRTGAAVIGASLMLGFGVLSMDEANRAIDMNTIVLLFGMMIVVANLRLSGFFRLVSSSVVRHIRRPWLLLAAVVFVTGFFSAFFVNDTICLVFTPIVYEITSRLKRNPVPYLLAVAMSSNIGGMATITGNPQNIMIGSLSKIPYREFAASQTPTALIGLVIVTLLLLAFYRREFRDPRTISVAELPEHLNHGLMWKSLVVALAMMVLFFIGEPIAKVAIVAGGFLLLSRRVKTQKVYREIDFSLLTLFAGLFVVVAGIEKTTFFASLVSGALSLQLERVPVLSVVAAALGNVVSNVPAVMILKSVVTRLPDVHRAWLTLAMASTLSGNLTINGSVANLIVVERARQHNVRIGFWDYFRVGAVVTVLTMSVGIARL